MNEICGDRAASCVCLAKPGHDGDHGCYGHETCKGTWRYGEDGILIPVTNPLTGGTFGTFMMGFLPGMMFDD